MTWLLQESIELTTGLNSSNDEYTDEDGSSAGDDLLVAIELSVMPNTP